jgi:uracil DNA glycosylase
MVPKPFSKEKTSFIDCKVFTTVAQLLANHEQVHPEDYLG